MRVLYDPTTALTIGSAVFSVVGGIAGGIGQRQQAEAEADFYRAQQEQERLAMARDQEALATERSRTMARARAVFAAQGGDTTDGTAGGVLEAVGGSFGRRELELIHDSEARIRSLDARAQSAATAGRSAMWSSIFSGIGAGARGAGSLFRGGSASEPSSSGGAYGKR